MKNCDHEFETQVSLYGEMRGFICSRCKAIVEFKEVLPALNELTTHHLLAKAVNVAEYRRREQLTEERDEHLQSLKEIEDKLGEVDEELRSRI